MPAKLPEIRMKSIGHRISISTTSFSSRPVMPASTSVSSGRSVKVNTVASSADHKRMNRKASHGTPGWKYERDAQSSSANGRVNRNLMNRSNNEPASFTRPQIHPTNTTPKRTMPAQKNQMVRPASHHGPRQFHETPVPPHEHAPEAHDAAPEDPDGAPGVPPRQQQRREEPAAPGAERQRVERSEEQTSELQS